MTGFAFEAQCCPDDVWRVLSTASHGAVSRAWVECTGCAHRRVITVSWRPARRDEQALGDVA